MKVMSKIVVCAFFLAWSGIGMTGSKDASNLPRTTHDGRFKTRCDAWGIDRTKELCELSFFRLIAQPEQYHGRLVGVTGFLVEDFGRFVLFPNQGSYDAGIDVEGVEITGGVERNQNGVLVTHPPDIPVEVRQLARAGGAYPVFVVGTFDAKHVGVSAARLGVIRVHHMLLASPVPKGKSSRKMLPGTLPVNIE